MKVTIIDLIDSLSKPTNTLAAKINRTVANFDISLCELLYTVFFFHIAPFFYELNTEMPDNFKYYKIYCVGNKDIFFPAQVSLQKSLLHVPLLYCFISIETKLPKNFTHM